MKNPITIIILLVVVVIALAAYFKPSPAVNQSGNASVPVLFSDSYAHDFGNVSMADGKVRHEFKIKNTTTEKIDIKKMYTSCMCTEALFIKGDVRKGPFGMTGHGYAPPVGESLEPNEEAVIEVVFNPAAHGPAGVGPINRAVYVEGDSTRLAEFLFTANVTP